MSSLSTLLSETVGRAFAAEGLDAAFGKVTVSNRPDLAQFQCNGALAAAKAAKQPPRAIAEKIAERLKAEPIFREVTLAGPGFINLNLTDAYLGQEMNRILRDARLGVSPRAKPRTVVLDYGGANIAKPMHVGHLRAGIIGDSLRRIYKFAGDRTIGDVHLGDWGLQMGMIISELELRQPGLPYFDKNFTGPYSKESPVTLAELEEMYPKASRDSKENPERMEISRQATAELQDGRPGYRALWQHFFDISVVALRRDYGNLGVEFDLWKGEAIVHDLIAPMIADMKKQGLVEESDGAQVVRVAEETDKHEIPPVILVKSDGAFMYATTDLATIVDRVKCQDPDLSIYVVDHRQSLHFVQVFRAAKKAKINGKGELVHLGYGTMNGTDGKPFKTRAGGVMRLDDLFQMVTDEATTKITEHKLGEGYDPAEKIDIAHKVGVAALKFADLSNNPIANYVFDLDRFSSFEGKTGPYLLYAAVRVKSLLRKAREQNDAPGTILPPEPGERDLLLALGQLPDAIEAAYADLAPNKIADFAFTLGQTFSAYYANFHILSETDTGIRRSRLAIAELVLKELELCLELLGIATPERMSAGPTLRTERLILRPWRAEDLEPFAALNADDRVTRTLAGSIDRAASDAMAARFSESFSRHGFGYWAVERPGVARFIGALGLSVPGFDAPFMPAVEIGWRLAFDHWGKGYATEGARAALDYGFNAAGLEEIVSFTAAGNTRSRAVMERLGMRTDPKEDFGHVRLGPDHPLYHHVLYRLRRADWRVR